MPTKQTEDQEKAAEAAKAWEAAAKKSATKNALESIAERALLRQHGLTSVKDTGEESVEEVVEHGKIRSAIYKIATAPGLIVSKEDRDTLPVERYGVTEQILDQVPSPRPGQEDKWEAQSAMDRRAWFKADVTIWKQIQTGPTTVLQRWVWEAVERGELPEGATLVKTKDVVFVTAEPKYIRQNLLLPVADSYVLDAEGMGKMFALFGNHNPALRAGAQKLLKATTTEAGKKAAASFVINSNE
jgi:hypothetical protein